MDIVGLDLHKRESQLASTAHVRSADKHLATLAQLASVVFNGGRVRP